MEEIGFKDLFADLFNKSLLEQSSSKCLQLLDKISLAAKSRSVVPGFLKFNA